MRGGNSLSWPSGRDRYVGSIPASPACLQQIAGSHAQFGRYREPALGWVDEAVIAPPGHPMVSFRLYEADPRGETGIFIDSAADPADALAGLVSHLKRGARTARGLAGRWRGRAGGTPPTRHVEAGGRQRAAPGVAERRRVLHMLERLDLRSDQAAS